MGVWTLKQLKSNSFQVEVSPHILDFFAFEKNVPTVLIKSTTYRASRVQDNALPLDV
jgi:hypothetical protein